MALLNSPATITNGLVFSYDSANRKSYAGPPIQNLLTNISPNTTSGTGYSFIGGSEVVDIPQLGPTTVPYCQAQNNYSAVSSWCCPNLFYYGSGISVSPSTLYTYGIVYRCDSGYANANYMYRYEYNSGTYVTEQGVWNASNQTYLGNGWYWAWGTFTTSASTNTLNSLHAFYYQYSTFYDKLSIAKALLVQGNYSGLHPKYWPEVGTSRSSTQAILDLTNNNTLTANSLTYASDGTFSWSSGVDASISAPASSNFAFGTGDFSVECWIYPTSFSGYQHMIALPEQYTFGLKANTGDGAIYFYSTPFTTYGSTTGWTLVQNAWNHVVMTRASSTAYCYLNGILKGSKVGFTNNFTSQILKIGNGNPNEYLPKQISSVKIYSRALSATEVAQNFNAMRGRYGL